MWMSSNNPYSRWNPVLWLEACCGRMIKAFPKAHSIEYYILSNILYAQIQDWGLIGAHCQTPPPPISEPQNRQAGCLERMQRLPF